jgi:hypothetical protein
MKYFKLNQKDINDLLGLITSPALSVTANSVPRVHELQALLSAEPVECECNKLNAVRDRFSVPARPCGELPDEILRRHPPEILE